jgi:tetratricopeptide (TPR) repeat protein
LFTGSIREIDSSITKLQHGLSILPRSDPRRPFCVHGIALGQLLRHRLSNQREDLDKAIVNFTESILLSPLSWLQHGPEILDALFQLAHVLFLRSNVSKQPEDAICATKCLSHLRDQPHEIPSIPRHQVTAHLVDALALQVKLEAGNLMQNIREMAVLTRKLLEMSDVDATHFIIIIHGAVFSKIRPGIPNQPLDELIEFSRVARKRRPDLLEAQMTFAYSLVCRYNMTCVNDDYEEAASILDEIIAYRSPENSQDETVAKARATATALVTAIAGIRSIVYQTPENVEEAIYRSRLCANSSSLKEHCVIVTDPEAVAEGRFYHFGSIEGVEESPGNSMADGLSQEYTHTIGRMRDLLFGTRNTDDTTEIDEAVEKGRSILASSPDESILRLFGDLLFAAFHRTNKIEYLNESISVRRQLIENPLLQAQRFLILSRLSWSLLARSHDFPGYRTQDLDEAMELYSQYVSSAQASVPDRFSLACTWAFFARRYRHSSVSTAYATALSLMQDTVLFSPTLQLQHATLATDDFGTRSLSLDYASYRVDQHQLKEAIEVLERGRALLWSEMHHLRASIDRILEVDPDLGHKFAAVNRDLEQLTKSKPPSHKLSMDDSTADGLRAVDPFGRLVLKQFGLLKERAKLISQIQALPGFDSFLTSPPFDTLQSAASSGPVIIINHSEWRSDILIVLHNKPPSLIPTPDDFFERAGALKDKLLGSRHAYGLDSKDYNDALTSVLAELYTLVGQPVIDRLRDLQVPEQSRIWWCPTSIFCSLPLHAMGPIPSDDDEMRYFLDLFVCSYTPTLSALIQSRRRDSSSRSSDIPSLLLVAQPDLYLPTVGGEIQAVQALDIEVTSLISEAATPDTVIDAFHHHGFVHFACHGKLEAGKPFEAGFELHGLRSCGRVGASNSHSQMTCARRTTVCTMGGVGKTSKRPGKMVAPTRSTSPRSLRRQGFTSSTTPRCNVLASLGTNER